jgi:quercetin dioxygenase-like cupin family protein
MGRVDEGFALTAEDGELIWLQGGLCVIKVPGESTGEQFTLCEQVMPKGMSTPIHIQPDEDEVFYVLDGAMTFYLDGELIPAEPGAIVGIPRGSAHGFRVESETARFLVLNTPAGHERWFRAAGEPATSRTLPSGPFDEERVAAASREFGYGRVGPFPDEPGAGASGAAA